MLVSLNIVIILCHTFGVIGAPATRDWEGLPEICDEDCLFSSEFPIQDEKMEVDNGASMISPELVAKLVPSSPMRDLVDSPFNLDTYFMPITKSTTTEDIYKEYNEGTLFISYT
jgi:hypothetical protein